MEERFKEVMTVISRITGVGQEEIERCMKNPNYKVIEIPKKSGGVRILMVPEITLSIRKTGDTEPDYYHFYCSAERQISAMIARTSDIEECVKSGIRVFQRQLLKEFLYKFKTSNYAHCSVPGRSVVTNVAPHKESKHFMKIDFKDAFPTVTSQMVADTITSLTVNGPILPFVGRCDKGTAESLGYLVSRLTTFRDQLPQGSPCSPYLMNLVCKPFDADMAKFAKEKGMIFTRYMDDNTLSSKHPISNDDVFSVIQIAAKHGFVVNARKTSMISIGPYFDPMITGIRIGNDGMAVPRKTIEWYRTMIKRATWDKEIDEGKVFGVLSWVLAIEGDIPKRMQKPLKEFLIARCPDKQKDYERFFKDIESEELDLIC